MSVNNMGKPINNLSRQKGIDMLKEVGVKFASERYFCVRAVAEDLERDKPFEAMEKAMKYVDLTGAYRLFAELLVNRKIT